VRDEPDRYVATVSKAKRKGKLLIDYLRNARGATAVCAFSTRARPGAPVATPIAWSELTPTLRPERFNVRTIPARLAAGPDPWRDFGEQRPRLSRSLLAKAES
jgi:bifunctional non-homologous end joining protein LigD